MRQKYFFVYILTNFANTVLYIGITNNILRRVYEHKEKSGDGFTKKYNVNKLIYYEAFDNAEVAIKREKTLKNLVRRKKIALIEKMNPDWEDLYDRLG